MGWIWTILTGGIVGWLGSKIAKTDSQMGILANVLVGIVGSSLGFWAAGVLGFAAYGLVAQWIVAVVGAVLLIAILKVIGVFK